MSPKLSWMTSYRRTPPLVSKSLTTHRRNPRHEPILEEVVPIPAVVHILLHCRNNLVQKEAVKDRWKEVCRVSPYETLCMPKWFEDKRRFRPMTGSRNHQ